MSNISDQPLCSIIAGPNGAGKTTFALKYLPSLVHGLNFVNADMMAQGLSPLNADAALAQAGRLFLETIDRLIVRREPFAFETTLSGRSHFERVKALKADGWRVEMTYLWIPDERFSMLRVAERVKQGGHGVPKDAIFRRYARSVRNLFAYAAECDYTMCYDNSGSVPRAIFCSAGVDVKVWDSKLYDKIRKEAGI